jgi:hypothetical protein
VKGAGYSMEAVLSIAIILAFVLGGLTVPGSEQNWQNYRMEVSAQDITYSLQNTYLNDALKAGNTGSIKTVVQTVSEKDFSVDGTIRNLPIGSNKVGFYTEPKDRYQQDMVEVDGGQECSGDLEEISSRSEEDPRMTAGSSQPASSHDGEKLYIGDLDPTGSGSGSENYDSLWVDRGKNCQFNESEGPFQEDDIFKWNTTYYEIKDISEANLKLYEVSQAVRIREYLEREVNSVDTSIEVDGVNFSEIGSQEYHVAVFRKDENIESIKGGNKTDVLNHLKEGSVLVLANLNADNFDDKDFLSKAGFRYRNVSYEDPYNGNEVNGYFPESEDAQTVETYFSGLGGQNSSLSIKPSNALSNTSSTIQSSKTILRSKSKHYNFSEWDRTNSSMVTKDSGDVDEKPSSECYTDGSVNEALTMGNLKFADGEERKIINAELGGTQQYCSENNKRGIKVDDISKTILDRQVIELAGRRYQVNITGNRSVRFEFKGDKHVELVSRRKSFPGFEGKRISILGYEQDYETEDLKLISSIIHWLRGNSVSIKGSSSEGAFPTSSFSGIKDETYLPYKINLRWER